MKIAGIIGAEIIVFFSSSIGLSKSNKKKLKITHRHGQYCKKCKTANSPNNPIHGGCLIEVVC